MKAPVLSPLPRDKIIVRIAGVILIFAFLIAARIYNPFESELITCRFKELTGYECPTCGLTRSVYSLLSLNIIDSINYHPLGCLLILGLIALLIRFSYELITGKELAIPAARPLRRVMAILIPLLFFSTWIIRLFIKIQARL